MKTTHTLPNLFALGLAGLASLTMACAADPPSGDGAPVAPPAPPVVTPPVEDADEPLDFTKVILDGKGLVGRPVPPTLTSKEALEDVRFFGFFLKYAYGAYPYLEGRGTDFQGPLAALEKRVRAQATWTPRELFDALEAFSGAVVRDEHFSLFMATKPPRYVSSEHRWGAFGLADATGAAGVDLQTCKGDGIELLPDQLFFDGTGTQKQLAVLSRDPRTSLACGTKKLDLVPIAPSGRALSPDFSEKALDADTYYIRLPSFSTVDPAQHSAFRASGGKAHGYAKVVLDLRGNGGGDPSFFIEWLKALGVVGHIRTPRLLNTESFAADVLTNNGYESFLHDQQLDPLVKQDFLARAAELKDTLHDDIAKGAHKRYVGPDAATPDAELDLVAPQGAFAGEVTVLVDAACASACEFAAFVSKQLEHFAVLSETNTAGAGRGANPSPLPLPSSSIVVYIPIGIVSHPETYVAEGAGVSPELWVSAAAMKALYP